MDNRLEYKFNEFYEYIRDVGLNYGIKLTDYEITKILGHCLNLAYKDKKNRSFHTFVNLTFKLSRGGQDAE